MNSEIGQQEDLWGESNNILNTVRLKIDVTHLYDYDLLRRQAQRQSFGTCPVKKNAFFCSFQDIQSFFEFLIPVIKHYHINELDIFCDSFKWFCLQINCEAKYFHLLSKALWLRINSFIEYYFQIWNEREHIIIRRVMGSLIGPMDIETTYIYIYIYKCIHRIWH